jgi:hypothetical protein
LLWRYVLIDSVIWMNAHTNQVVTKSKGILQLQPIPT